MKKSQSVIVLLSITILITIFTVSLQDASAHQNGCHILHSCPSDTGSYVCGDLGYHTYCPENTPACNAKLWNHVYNPKRLQVIDSCKTVTGVIQKIKTEADGDMHIQLKLDSQYSNLLTKANVNGQNGNLVLEPICQKKVTQKDAISACKNFSYELKIPKIGTHVKVTGSYVLDLQHGKWAEIHPVSSIEASP
jgi:hypothetical protein